MNKRDARRAVWQMLASALEDQDVEPPKFNELDEKKYEAAAREVAAIIRRVHLRGQ